MVWQMWMMNQRGHGRTRSGTIWRYYLNAVHKSIKVLNHNTWAMAGFHTRCFPNASETHYWWIFVKWMVMLHSPPKKRILAGTGNPKFYVASMHTWYHSNSYTFWVSEVRVQLHKQRNKRWIEINFSLWHWWAVSYADITTKSHKGNLIGLNWPQNRGWV
jgi:hypothetical protein